jgi:hypothetical protein
MTLGFDRTMKPPDTIQPEPVGSGITADACLVVVVYEDMAAHERAMEMAHRLAAECAEDPSLVFRSWNFRELAEPGRSREAIESAANAEVIVISGHGNDLPVAVSAWLEACAAARARSEGALALLLAEPFMLSAASGAIMAKLEHAARVLRMDFVPLVPYPVERMIASLRVGSGLTGVVWEEMFDRPRFDHWGLNE